MGAQLCYPGNKLDQHPTIEILGLDCNKKISASGCPVVPQGWTNLVARARAGATSRSAVLGVYGSLRSASPASKSIKCKLPHGAEGGFALPFTAVRVSCAKAQPVVSRARLYNGCNLTRVAGCKVDGYVCRVPHPETPGHVDPGDQTVCIDPPRSITFEQPG